MGLRPAKCYAKFDRKPYTRLSRRKPKKSYIKGVPIPKIHHYEVGKPGTYPVTAYLVSKDNVQIRSNALEAIRITISRHLATNVGEKSYFMKIMVFPHHIMRENAAATGAGADRYSSGMQRSFGKPIGQAARVRANQRVVMVKASIKSEAAIKAAFRKAAAKLSGHYITEFI